VDKVRKPCTSAKYGLDTPRKPLWYARGMLEGKCPKCGVYRIGWALRFPQNQTCPNCGTGLEITESGRRVYCGTGLEITESGRRVSTGYSPFTAEEYRLKPPTDVPSPPDKEKERKSGIKKEQSS